ncbi:MAG TPA: oligoendopeptidase F [Anaeromyxobacteraceae bacterium]|nr:oligoendopeptidase F [Anaeromyxobacteraceae bacterium]
MPSPIVRASAIALASVALALAAPAGAKDRSEIPEKYRWNLADLFPSEASWVAAREKANARVAALASHQGKLGRSAASLRSALDEMYGARLDLERLYVYASSLSDEDTRAARPREMKQAAQQLAVDYSAAVSWVQPEILSLDPERVRGFLKEDPGLAPYRFYLEDVLRWRPHTLSAPEERIAAQAGDLAGAGSSVYGLLKDADLPWPAVKLSTGEEVRLDTAGFALARSSRAKEDRDRVFDAFFGAVKTYERSIGAALYATVKAHLFEQKVHKFGSTLEASLFRNAIPATVYRQLLSDVRRSLPTFHRYLALRQRMLGLEKLRYQDLYVPLVASVDLKFEPEEARDVTLAAFQPLGKRYVDALRTGYQSRWTDYLPSTGKRSGAYSTGVYGVHPYQLLNYNGKYDDLSTLAHESGHSMHTWLASKAQPYPTADYPIFVAEVASTLNENLLLHHMLGRTKDDATRLALLGNYLDGMRQTLFRQTQFAEFELALHEKAEKGETLTGENLTALYLGIVRDYYGHAKGVCQVDDLLGVEWAYVPHFHYDYYVYQYATSLVASTALARGIREEARKGKTARRDAYLRMLEAGGSKYPVDLLREAGVDMTTSAPFDAAIAEMNAVMDEMERILARQAKAGKR